jgi:hypothetical protein
MENVKNAESNEWIRRFVVYLRFDFNTDIKK